MIGRPRADGAVQVTTMLELRLSVAGAAGLAGFHAHSSGNSAEYELMPKLLVD